MAWWVRILFSLGNFNFTNPAWITYWLLSLGGVHTLAWVTHSCSPSYAHLKEHWVCPSASPTSSSATSPTVHLLHFISPNASLHIVPHEVPFSISIPLVLGVLCEPACLLQSLLPQLLLPFLAWVWAEEPCLGTLCLSWPNAIHGCLFHRAPCSPYSQFLPFIPNLTNLELKSQIFEHISIMWPKYMTAGFQPKLSMHAYPVQLPFTISANKRL